MKTAAWLLLILVTPAAAASGKDRCAGCHPRQTAGFLETGMGRSMQPGVPVLEDWSGRLGATRFTVRGSSQSIARGQLTSSAEVLATIGSGNHAFGFLVRQGEYLFQSPLSWYRRQRAWDVAPGYEGSTHPDFNRPVVAECLFCHADRATPAKNSLNRYPAPDASIAAPISCERCHGDVNAHLTTPRRGSVVNPARLAPARRDAVCEQCHLGGEARILNEGRAWHDFAAGEALEDTFTVFVGAPRGRFKVVGHVEQMALSRCAQASGDKMWCGTCHDPHGKPADPAAHYRARCLGCHTEAPHRSAEAAGRARDCVGCHMTRRRARDSGHAAFTDHRIQRRPDRGEAATDARPDRLVAWRPAAAGAVAVRNLGLAYASAGEKEQSVGMLAEAGRILAPLASADDAEVLAALGLVRLLQDEPKEAALLLERAVAARPAWAPYYQKLAIAWNAAGNPGRALAVIRRALEIDPSMEGLYHTLAKLEKDPAARRRALERYLEFAPQSLVTREALR